MNFIDEVYNCINADSEVLDILKKEEFRQKNYLSLIASENYASLPVMAACGSIFTNKYAEGYPGKRYYGGCEWSDAVENLAISRLNKIFNVDYSNVQPHAGSQANMAAYLALIKPGDKILGMNLNDGGHLTHGSKVNFSGFIYNAYSYGVAEDGYIDYDYMENLAKKERPNLIIAGFSAYSRHIDWKRVRYIADSVGAYFLADIAHVAGLIGANLYPSPVGYADVITSTTHKTMRGPRGGFIITKNKDKISDKINSKIFPGMQGGPLMNTIAAKAIAFGEALGPSFKLYQMQVIENAKNMADVFIQRKYKVVSGGTDNHLFLVDLSNKNITGQDAESVLNRVNIVVNKNTVPGEKRSPFITSGIRIGTPAITTRNFDVKASIKLANIMCDVLDNWDNDIFLNKIKLNVIELCQDFPVYGEVPKRP